MTYDPSPEPVLTLLGCIADDVTGATDLAINLVQGGMRVIQWLVVPSPEELQSNATDAVVVALKTRSVPAAEAVDLSAEALNGLRLLGCPRFYFKYCSTFDSTDQGNIGPVAEALMDALQVRQTIFCPAFPENGRTVYQGHLFVRDKLLSESGMERHPLNPMADANLVRVLQRQARRQVGLLSYEQLSAGAESARQRLAELAAADVGLVVTDALDDDHLQTIADAVAPQPLVTGGSGLARHLPRAYRQLGLLRSANHRPSLPRVTGRSLILSGSCSSATQRQVASMQAKCPCWQLDVDAAISDLSLSVQRAANWAMEQDENQPLLIYSTAAPDAVERLQQQHGRQRVAETIEAFHAQVAAALTGDGGVRKLIIAGGETAGAVVRELGIRALRIGPEIAPGVPWTEAIGTRTMALALKSGNFGDDNFFDTALGMLS